MEKWRNEKCRRKRLDCISFERHDWIVAEEFKTMATKTAMLHVRVDEKLKDEAAEALAGIGLSLSDAVRILLTRVAAEGGMPPGLTTNAEAYDAWFRAKVHEALDDPCPPVPHDQAMQDIQALIDGKRRVRN